MFEVKGYAHGNCFISDGNDNYMHRDGEIVSGACEYWPTKKQAQAVLDKYQPPHVWKDGDVGKTEDGEFIILAHCTRDPQQHFIVLLGNDAGSYEVWDPCVDPLHTSYLFNIKNVLENC